MLDEDIVYAHGDMGYNFPVVNCYKLTIGSCVNMTGHTPTGGCSREYSTMGESLIERRRVWEEVLRDVNHFCHGKILIVHGE